MRPVVVLPTYNEAGNVVELLGALRQAVPAADVLVVDDASPDGTADLAEEAAADLGNIKVLRRTGRASLGDAYRHGFTIAFDEGYDVIISMDCDFSHDPARIPAMIAVVEQGADVVIGSRYVPGGRTVDWPLHRRLLSRWGNRYTGIVLGMRHARLHVRLPRVPRPRRCGPSTRRPRRRRGTRSSPSCCGR